jgi:acetolactate decarboxylase
MREALRMGKTQSRTTIEDINSKPNAFAVGALTNLDGEITIFDGNVYTASTKDGESSITNLNGNQFDSATLLTLSYVDSWHTMHLPLGLTLEEAIELAALNFKVNTDEPFPFYIIGTTNKFHLHVINGFCPVANPELEKRFQPWRMNSSQKQEVTVVGFYAKNQEGIMTHHGSNIHIHGIMEIDGKLTTGHLDSVELESDALIFIPAN